MSETLQPRDQWCADQQAALIVSVGASLLKNSSTWPRVSSRCNTQGLAPGKLLDSVTPERRPAAEEVLKDSNTITQSVLFQNAAAQYLRDWAIGFALSFDGVQRRLSHGASKLGVSYRESPIVDQYPARRLAFGPTAEPAAGDRAPDVGLPGGGGLYDVFCQTTGFTLMIFAGHGTRAAETSDLGAVEQAIARSTADRVLQVLVITATAFPASHRTIVDQDGRLATSHGIDGVGLVLVRPDLHIGFRSDSLAAFALVQHLSSILASSQTRSSAAA